MFFSLAWRNIWRNRRRSMISIASIILAVVVALLMRSMQYGFYERSIENVVSFYTGYIQVHTAGFWDKKTLNNSMVASDSLYKAITQNDEITVFSPRIESFALVSTGDVTKGAMIVGIDPEKENSLSGLADKVIKGKYLNLQSEGIMLAEDLADHLNLDIGDTVIVLGQGYHDVTAAGKYEVTGIIKFPIPDMNKVYAYLSLPQAQYLYAAENRLTAVAIMIDNQRLMGSVMDDLKDKFGEGYEIMSWAEMMPELVQSIEADNVGGVIMLFIIYMVVGFGILGTVLMMTLERNREFGMLLAIGMKQKSLRYIVTLESILMSFVGVVVGVILAIPVIFYFYHNPIELSGELAEMTMSYGFEPIFPVSLDPTIFLWQIVAIFIIALTASLYPVWKISQIEPVSALRTG